MLRASAIDELPLRLTNIIQPPPAPVAVSPVQPPAAPVSDAAVGMISTPSPASPPLASALMGHVVSDPAADKVDLRLKGQVVRAAGYLGGSRIALAPSLGLLNEVTLTRANQLRPELLGDFRPRRMIPRSQLQLPICRDGAAQSQPALLFGTLLEEPALSTPQAFCYLPRYKLAVADVIGGQQLRVRLENDAQGGKLTVHLISYADPAIEVAARNARPIDLPLTVELRYPRTIGGETIWDAWNFQEIAGEIGGLQAVLHVDAQSLPQLHLALLTNGTTLVVRRTIEYAVGAAYQPKPPYRDVVDTRKLDLAMRRPPIGDGDDIIREPPYNGGGGIVLEPPPEELFEARSAAVEDTLACSFPPSYGYIFQDGPQTDGQNLALTPSTKVWQGREYTYYQDPARPWRFFYLPDAFKIARQDASPRAPTIKLSTNNGQITMSYVAAPFTDAKRLDDAARQLGPSIPPGTRLPDGVSGPIFELLTTVKATFRVALPQAGGASGPLVERPNVGLDFNNPAKGLPGGIYDSVTMSLDDFLPVYDALCSDQRRDGANTLFLGEIDIAIGDTPLPPIPFVARLNDLVGELFSYEEADLPASTDPDPVGVSSTLTNVIESPLRIDSLAVTLHRAGDLASETRALLHRADGQDLTFPLILAPGESLRLLVTPETTLAGDGPCDAVFDLDQVAALPDRERVLDAIVDPNVPVMRAMPVAVKVPRAVFGNDTDPGGALYAVSVRFPGRGPYGEDIDFDLTAGMIDDESKTITSEILNKTVTLYLPARSFLLRQSDPWSYDYSVTLRRKQGVVAGESGTRTGTTYWPRIS